MNRLFLLLETLLAEQPVPVMFDPPLRAPPCGQSVQKAEQRMGVRFPDEIRALYQLYDGEQNAVARPSRPRILPCGLVWLPVHQVVELWTLGREMAQPPEYFGFPDTEESDMVKAQNFSAKWIPIAADNNSCRLYIDLDPGPAGRIGQLIYYSRDMGIVRDEVVAISFTAYLQQLIHCLESGLLMVTPKGWYARATGKQVFRLWQLTGPDWQPPSFPG